jgi:Cytochrome P460
MKRSTFAPALAVMTALIAAGCSSIMTPPPKPINDGELAVPADYKSWPKFLSAVQRPDAKQVREIYMNNAGANGTPGGGFPNGTVFVMENYAAQANLDGTLKNGSDGKLMKGELLRVFVMGKDAGWGEGALEALKNGSWVYTSYLADGKQKGPEDLNTCRACHLPLTAKKDFVHRYDEHFAQKR